MWVWHIDQDGREFYESAAGAKVWTDSLLSGSAREIVERLHLAGVFIVCRDGGPALVDESGDELPLTLDSLPGDRVRIARQLAALETYASQGPRFCALCGESFRYYEGSPVSRANILRYHQ